MKIHKVIFILILIILLSPKCFAEDELFIQQLRGHLEYNEEIEDYDEKSIYLEPDSNIFINISQPQSINSKSLNLRKADFKLYDPTLYKGSTFASQEHAIRSLYGDVSENYGKFTIGTEYDSGIDDAEMTYTTGVYTRIDGKHAALTISARKETGNSYSYYSDKIVISPELKLTSRLSLLEVLQTDVKQTIQKNEVILRYNPKLKNHPDDFFIELGAGNTYREMEYIKSSIKFSTRFKF